MMDVTSLVRSWTTHISPEIQSVILAMCVRESSLDPWAIRYESHYSWPWQVKENARDLNISFDTELQLQKFSYGLLQVMGGTARWQGFKGPLMQLCCDHRAAFDHGLNYFLYQFERYDKNIVKALCAYNGGNVKIVDGKYKNQTYADEVLQFRNQLKKHWEMSA
jgi:hypothetical protein